MGKIALVTGGGGTLGTAVAERLLSIGCRIVLAGRSKNKLESSPLNDALKFAGDLSQHTDVERLFGAIHQEYGESPSLLAHCAGSVMIRPMHRMTHEQYKTCLENNLDSAFLTLKKFVAGLLDSKQGGSAVLVSSVAARIGIGNHAAVAAAKAGIEGLVRSAAADYANRGIRVNGIAPGLFRSTATEGFFTGEKAENQLAAQYPLGRYGSVDDEANAICWLLSSEADWITGQILAVDGGFSSIRPLVKG
jgi:NAD(P)-dependent dehydrogenase (short-subunit alcohol dehydrogenase family)